MDTSIFLIILVILVLIFKQNKESAVNVPAGRIYKKFKSSQFEGGQMPLQTSITWNELDDGQPLVESNLGKRVRFLALLPYTYYNNSGRKIRLTV